MNSSNDAHFITNEEWVKFTGEPMWNGDHVLYSKIHNLTVEQARWIITQFLAMNDSLHRGVVDGGLHKSFLEARDTVKGSPYRRDAATWTQWVTWNTEGEYPRWFKQLNHDERFWISKAVNACVLGLSAYPGISKDHFYTLTGAVGSVIRLPGVKSD